MIGALAAFEWRYHSRQASFAAASLLFFLFGAMLSRNFGADNVAINSPYLVTEAFGLLSLVAIVAGAVFASSAVLRDDEHQLREIVYSSPIGRFPYLVSRFAGAFLATLTTVAFSAVGMMAGTVTIAEAHRVAPMDVRPYLAAFATITVPNVLFVTALLFAFALLTRNAMATWAAAIALYIAYFIAAALTESPLMAASRAGGGSGSLASLLDPLGLSSFFDVTRYWTPAEKNHRFIALSGSFLANRLIWIAATAAVLGLTYRRFDFTIRQRAPRAPIARDVDPAIAPTSLELPFIGTKRTSWIGAWRSCSAIELRSLAAKSSWLLLLLWIALAISEIRGDVLATEYGSISWPATTLILGALQTPITLIGTILIVYFAAEIFWREQRFGMAQIVDSTPVPASAIVAAKWTALAALVGALLLGGAAAGVLVQLSRGYVALEPMLYLAFFYFAGVPLLLWSALAIFVHALSPGKYAGMIFFVLCVIVLQRAEAVGLEHPLWQFASAPRPQHSDLNGFGHRATPFHWFMLHWTLLSLLLVTSAARLWRHVAAPVRERLRRLMPPSRSMGFNAIAVLATGGWLFYNTNVAREYLTAAQLLDWKAGYERSYKRYEEMPQPRITSVATSVDLDPERRGYRIAGSYSLVNDNGRALTTVFVAVRRDARIDELSIPTARLAGSDRRFGMHRFEFDPPLQPGARAELRFGLTYEPRGFPGGQQDDAVIENGSWLMSFRAFPTLGYRRSYELQSERERRKRGLAGSGAIAADADGAHGAVETSDEEWIDLATTVTTAPDQIALAPGRLIDSGERDGRRWFRYRTDSPILNRFAIASARYAVARKRHGAVAIEVYHDPSHHVNVEHMLDTAAETLEVMESRFGSYPHRELRIIELASHWPMAGFALPGSVYLNETRGFLTDRRDPDRPDLVARRVAHEVAHQWFGHRLHSGNVEGASVLVESLTKYAELLVIERMHGPHHVRRLLEIELDRYLSGRANESVAEVPLVRTGSQPYLFYSKGAIALWSIRDLIGEQAVNDAIAAVMREERPTAVSLARHLSSRADEPVRARVDEWMNRIVLYDLRIEEATTRKRSDGRYEIELKVTAAKLEADGMGRESEVALAEMVEFEIAGDDRVLDSPGRVLQSGRNQIRLIVDTAPTSVTLDPRITRIDRNPRDNTKRIERPR
jgi:ABC-2 type transport system permease protein